MNRALDYCAPRISNHTPIVNNFGTDCANRLESTF